MDYTKSKVETFYSEKDANNFISSGIVGHLIAIVPKMSYFVIFYIPKEDIKNEVIQNEIKEKKELKNIKK